MLAAAILDHHYLLAQNKMQCCICIPDMREPRYRHHNHASTLITSKVMFNFFISSNFSDGHLGFMQIRKFPQSCHSGKRWI